MEDEHVGHYARTDAIIDATRHQLGIFKSSEDMTDDEIGEVMRFLGQTAPDTIWADDKPIMCKIGISLMLSLTLYEFPEFYERFELWQRN